MERRVDMRARVSARVVSALFKTFISTQFLYIPAFSDEAFCKPSLTCVQCPNGALCKDKSCALENPPLWTCNETQDLLLGDLSEWDGVKWINVSSTVRGTIPLARQNAAYASNDNFLFLYGGNGSSGGDKVQALFLNVFKFLFC